MINPIYRQKSTQEAIKKSFRRNKELPSMALASFLNEKEFLTMKKNNTIGWKKKVIPDKHCYEEKKISLPELQSFVHEITGKKPLSETAKRFSHGSYTLLHDNVKQSQGIAAYLFLGDWNPAWGGQMVFMKNGKTLGTFTPNANTLLLVKRKKGVRSFIKYVNHKAGKKSFRIISP